MSLSQFHAEHEELITAARQLIGYMKALQARYIFDGTEYDVHRVFASRGISLACYLEGVIKLAENELYPPAFSEIRASIEHQIADKLLFRAERCVQIQRMNSTVWNEFDENPPSGVLDKSYKNGRATITWEKFGTGHDHDLSLYYIITASADLNERDKTDIWGKIFNWSTMMRSLEINSILSSQTIEQIKEHYSFLSLYSHPDYAEMMWKTYDGPYSLGLGKGQVFPHYNHCTSELILLYVCYLAIEELRDFEAVAEIPPKVGLRDWQDVTRDIEEAEKLIFYAWFPGQTPHRCDKIEESYRQYWQRVEAGEDPHELIDPVSLSDDVVEYYTDPLTRLQRHHDRCVVPCVDS